MARRDLSALTTDQLRQQVGAMRKVHAVVTGIFLVIILAWVVGGYWRQNVAVFLSTVAMAVAIWAMQFSVRSGLEKELGKRGPTP